MESMLCYIVRQDPEIPLEFHFPFLFKEREIHTEYLLIFFNPFSTLTYGTSVFLHKESRNQVMTKAYIYLISASLCVRGKIINYVHRYWFLTLETLIWEKMFLLAGLLTSILCRFLLYCATIPRFILINEDCCHPTYPGRYDHFLLHEWSTGLDDTYARSSSQGRLWEIIKS